MFYDEGAYYSETIDGAVGTMTVARESSFPLTIHGYTGGWSELSYDQSGSEYAVAKVRAENAVGTQLWLGTPIEGLRIGGAYQYYRTERVGRQPRQHQQLAAGERVAVLGGRHLRPLVTSAARRKASCTSMITSSRAMCRPA